MPAVSTSDAHFFVASIIGMLLFGLSIHVHHHSNTVSPPPPPRVNNTEYIASIQRFNESLRDYKQNSTAYADTMRQLLESVKRMLGDDITPSLRLKINDFDRSHAYYMQQFAAFNALALGVRRTCPRKHSRNPFIRPATTG